MKLQLTGASRFCFIISIFVLISCGKNPRTTDENSGKKPPKITRNQIDSVVNNAVLVFNKGDMKGYTDLFTNEGVSLGPEGPPIIGRANIFKAYDNMYKSGITKIMIQPNNLFADNTLLSVDGIWSMANTKGVDVGHGKFLWVMTLENEQWKIVRDIYNYDINPSAQTGSK